MGGTDLNNPLNSLGNGNILVCNASDSSLIFMKKNAIFVKHNVFILVAGLEKKG